jgi:transposase
MLSLPANVPLYLYTTPTDMRKSFDGLHTLVRQVFELDPLDGHLFLFVNRRRDRIKLL